jgi:hypothetical protein
MHSSLSSLVRSEAEIAEDLMARTLEPIIGFTKAGEVVPAALFHALNPIRKVLALLMAVKALKSLGFRQDESVGPTEVSNLGGLPLGTVKPALRELEKQKLATSEKGKYHIPLHSLTRVAAMLREGESGES